MQIARAGPAPNTLPVVGPLALPTLLIGTVSTGMAHASATNTASTAKSDTRDELCIVVQLLIQDGFDQVSPPMSQAASRVA